MLIDGNATVGKPEDPSGTQRFYPNGGVLPEAPRDIVVGEDTD
jgi:hypothetical protein